MARICKCKGGTDPRNMLLNFANYQHIRIQPPKFDFDQLAKRTINSGVNAFTKESTNTHYPIIKTL